MSDDGNGYGDPKWDGVDPHADYLRNLPDPEPIPAWMQPTERGFIGERNRP